MLDGQGRPTTDPAAFYADPPGAILPFGAHKGSGLSFLCEVLAGALTGGFASHPQSPTAGRLVNNMTSIAFDPARFGGAEFFEADVARLIGWTKAPPPAEAGGVVLLPGEIEGAFRRDREADGIPSTTARWRRSTTSLAPCDPRIAAAVLLKGRASPRADPPVRIPTLAAAGGLRARPKSALRGEGGRAPSMAR